MAANRPSAELHCLATRRAEDARHYRDILHDLNDAGSELARLLHQQVTAMSGGRRLDGAWEAMALAYERVSRAICHGIILHGNISQPAASRTVQQRAAARRRIIREVEAAIRRQARVEEAVGDRSDAFGKCDDELSLELRSDLCGQPVPEVIADICRDLGLAAPAGDRVWQRTVPPDIAALCALAAQPRHAASEGEPMEPGPPIRLHSARPRSGKRLADAASRGFVLLPGPPKLHRP